MEQWSYIIFKDEEWEVLESKKVTKKSEAGCDTENAERASLDVARLTTRTGEPRTIAGEIIGFSQNDQ